MADPEAGDGPPLTFEEFVDPVDGSRWRIDVGFIDSNWSCIWGDGCEGILDHRAAELNQGCCSVGAHLVDADEAGLIAALGSALDPARFQNHAEAAARGVVAGDEQPATRVVDGACIFFNHPGFIGGEGCALHLAAIDEGDSPIDWKPSICWQAPIKVDRHQDGTRTLRRWGKADWGSDEEIAWCCTDANRAERGGVEGDQGAGPTAYRGRQPVAETLHQELKGLVGPEIAVELLARHRPPIDGNDA